MLNGTFSVNPQYFLRIVSTFWCEFAANSRMLDCEIAKKCPLPGRIPISRMGRNSTGRCEVGRTLWSYARFLFVNWPQISHQTTLFPVVMSWASFNLQHRRISLTKAISLWTGHKAANPCLCCWIHSTTSNISVTVCVCVCVYLKGVSHTGVCQLK